MDLKALYLKRESCRNFSGKQVDKKLLLDILEEARLAPSASNSQPWHFWLIDDQEKQFNITSDLREFTRKLGGMIIITSVDRIFTPSPRKHDYYGFDIGGITAHIMLSASQRGIQTCLIGSFDDEHVKSVLPQLKDEKIHIIILFGYSNDKPREKDRYPLKDKLTIV